MKAGTRKLTFDRLHLPRLPCWLECTNMLDGVYEYVGWSVRVCWLECTNMLVGVYECCWATFRLLTMYHLHHC